MLEFKRGQCVPCLTFFLVLEIRGKSLTARNFLTAFFNIMLTLTLLMFIRGLFGLNLVTEKDKIICVTVAFSIKT